MLMRGFEKYSELLFMIPHSKPWILDVDKDAVRAVLSSGSISQGKLVNQFQTAIAEYVGCPYAIAQSSGSAALVLALKTLNIGFGDSVVLPTYVCRSVLQAVLLVLHHNYVTSISLALLIIHQLNLLLISLQKQLLQFIFLVIHVYCFIASF